MLRLVSVVLFVLGGCPARSPEAVDVGRAYLEALADGRSDDAWDRLAPEARQRVSPEEHRRAVAALSAERRAQLGAEAGSLRSRRLTAEWPNAGGALRFEHRGGAAWVVTGELPRFDRQDTPQEALKTFARAFRARDWGTLLRLAPAEQRAALTPAVLQERFGDTALLTEVEAAVVALMDAGAGAAPAPNGWRFQRGRHRADLRLEDGTWRIVDVR